MKSLFVFLFASLIAYDSNLITEESTNPVTETKNECEVIYTLYAPEDYVTLELEEELYNLTSHEEITAFFKKHNAIASKLVEAVPNDEVFYSSGCGSWIFVQDVGICLSPPPIISSLEKRKCWAGVASDGTKYGFWWEWRYTC